MSIAQRELSDFLRRARASVDRTRAGLPADDRVRRVAGLRREEVAYLAGVSTDYYTRLEQGRRISPSPSVLDALARALDLDAAGRAHLDDLVGSRHARREPLAARATPRAGVHRLVHTLAGEPAFILGPRSEVLASNRLADALLTDFRLVPPRERNYTRWVLLCAQARELFVDWPDEARLAVESLRLDVAGYAHDPAVWDLVAELREGSAEFRSWWDEHRVQQRTHGTTRLRHPLVGELTVDYETLTFPTDPDLRLIVLTTEPGSASRRAVERLGYAIDARREAAPEARPSKESGERGLSGEEPVISIRGRPGLLT